jgi:hypothetical protein
MRRAEALQTLVEHVRSTIVTALGSIPASDRADLYAVSLWVQDVDDDPRRPTITVGYNTERQVAASTPRGDRSGNGSVASSAAEARWNFAFWLQNSLAVICSEDGDPAGVEARDAWAKQSGYWYSDAEEERDLDAALMKVAPLTAGVVEIAVGVVRELHRSGEVARLLGHPVPLLIHELEYYEQIAAQNEAANPPALVRDFSRWVRGL